MPTMQPRFRLVEDQARAIEGATESWMREHEQAMKVRFVEEILQLCHVVVEGLDRLQHDLFEDLCANRISDLDEADRKVTTVLEVLQKAFRLCRQAIDTMKAESFEVDGADQFAQDSLRLNRIHERHRNRWPRTDAEAVEESLANLDEATDIKDLIRELQS